MNVQGALKSFFSFEIGPTKEAQGRIFVLGAPTAARRQAEYKKIIETYAPESQKKNLLKSEKRSVFFAGVAGPVWIMQNATVKKGNHSGLLDESVYAWFRDQSGSLVAQFKTYQFTQVALHFIEADVAAVRGVVIGLELAAYNFLKLYKKSPDNGVTPQVVIAWEGRSGVNARNGRSVIDAAQVEARSVQLARHLVNLPPNDINPASVEEIVKKELGFGKNVSVDVWGEKKLHAENMQLLLAVGKGSLTPPRMIHIKYRPTGGKNSHPVAFVGKGITFDTGGLDIKPSSAMRLMKKDMGGAAAVLGLAYWVVHSKYSKACDFYLALAENGVDAASMRPGDLYTSRAGYIVEIDNTDAEGRLVLADVLDVAVTQKGKDEPEVVIDVATLTGAIKVALGADVAGLFSNDDSLASQLTAAGQQSGDLNWRMPLIQKYFGGLSSHFADFRNSADGFGGAITAALFLEKFCRGKKWAHLDVYSWNDKNNGALTSVGGSGQPVQALIEWLKSKSKSKG